jgi:hypothetical protein
MAAELSSPARLTAFVSIKGEKKRQLVVRVDVSSDVMSHILGQVNEGYEVKLWVFPADGKCDAVTLDVPICTLADGCDPNAVLTRFNDYGFTAEDMCYGRGTGFLMFSIVLSRDGTMSAKFAFDESRRFAEYRAEFTSPPPNSSAPPLNAEVASATGVTRKAPRSLV